MAELEARLESEELMTWINKVMARVDDVKKAKTEYIGLLSAIVYSDVMDHFAQESGPDGKWAEWSPSYKQYMDKIGRGGNKILQFSGKLRQSFNPANVKSSSQGVFWYNRTTTKGFPYAWWHNEGAEESGGTSRPFMWLSDKAIDDMTEKTLQYMMDEGI